MSCPLEKSAGAQVARQALLDDACDRVTRTHNFGGDDKPQKAPVATGADGAASPPPTNATPAGHRLPSSRHRPAGRVVLQSGDRPVWRLPIRGEV